MGTTACRFALSKGKALGGQNLRNERGKRWGGGGGGGFAEMELHLNLDDSRVLKGIRHSCSTVLIT